LDAFGLVVGNGAVSPVTRVKAVSLLSRATGTGGMVRGQIVDMFGEQNSITYDELLFLHAHKTGALIRVAAQLGVLAAGYGEDSPEMEAAVGYAERIGLAFQVIDDILDVTSTPEVLGKSIGKDQKVQKATYPALVGMDRARAEARELTAAARAALDVFSDKRRAALLAINDYLLKRDY
jgi:geranylgeranyl diphosphate synthase type II